MRGYENAHVSTNAEFIDHLLSGDQGAAIRESVLTKRLQFDTSPVLYKMVEDVCALLQTSKRQFLEMAVVDAINRANGAFSDAYKEASGQEFGEVVNEEGGE